MKASNGLCHCSILRLFKLWRRCFLVVCRLIVLENKGRVCEFQEIDKEKSFEVLETTRLRYSRKKTTSDRSIELVKKNIKH